MRPLLALLALLILFSCKKSAESIHPTVESITESIYASGVVKSRDQYSAYAAASGIVTAIEVREGDTIQAGESILAIQNKTQQFSRDNAALAYQSARLDANQSTLEAARQGVEVAKSKTLHDSALLERQQRLWDQKIGSMVTLEQRQLEYQQSKNDWLSAKANLSTIERQLKLQAEQSANNLKISEAQNQEFTVISEINGKVYDLLVQPGEWVGPQTQLAVIGNASEFLLELQVDEYDIRKVQPGQKVMVTLDSYADQVFEGTVTRIIPLMNVRSKTFLVEARFDHQPDVLYPNTSLEANIIIQTKKDALLIPRNYLLSDSLVVKPGGDTVAVKTGLKDFHMVEILSGISAADQLIKVGK